MFVTRASRHDKSDIAEFLESEWPGETFNIDKGVAFIAREGAIVGHIRMIELGPQTLVIDEMLVREDKRGQGVGRRLMQSAMNNRGGTLFLCTHPETVEFYEKFGFSQREFDDLPDEVRAHHVEVADYPTKEGHVHVFLTAR